MPCDLSPSNRPARVGFALLTASLIWSCDSQQDKPAPVPQSAAGAVEVGGAAFQAMAYADPEQAARAFGFDIRGAGLLPVRVSIGNHGSGTLQTLPRQTFLVDADGQAWPLLTSGQAFARLEQAKAIVFGAPRIPDLDNLDALTGFALDLSVGADFLSDTAPERRIGQNLSTKELRNPKIPAGQEAVGLLFFPGQDEAKGARALRLCYALDGQAHCLSLPLQGPPVPVGRARFP